VLEFPALASFPATGEAGKIYIDASTGKTYRWNGAGYTEISASAGIAVQDEGSVLTPAATSLNFIGTAITATSIGGAVSVNVDAVTPAGMKAAIDAAVNKPDDSTSLVVHGENASIAYTGGNPIKDIVIAHVKIPHDGTIVVHAGALGNVAAVTQQCSWHFNVWKVPAGMQPPNAQQYVPIAFLDQCEEIASAHRVTNPWDNEDYITTGNAFGVDVKANDHIMVAVLPLTWAGSSMTLVVRDVRLEYRYI